MPTPISAYTKERFAAPIGGGAKAFDVYHRGAGAPVVIMQELPGIGQEALAFADRLVDAGFEVWMPHWFGPIGRISLGGNVVRVLCMQREFQIFSKNQSSAVVDWMRALVAHVSAQRGGAKVGVVGMCLSGNFALTLIAEESVHAAVGAQPSLPVDKTSVHMSGDEIAAVRAACETKGPARAYRFSGDTICSGERFEALERTFNEDGRVRVILDVLEGKGHSVFTVHYDDAPASLTRKALDETIAYFRERLAP
ncbi:MAG: dienelactone hydrolase [Alphaproteobacteria bacterium]|nr:dienelactone hydrolase [Alphaproteobacteria bacterium]